MGFSSINSFLELDENGLTTLVKIINKKIQQSQNFPVENLLRIAVEKEVNYTCQKWEEFEIPYGHEILIKSLRNYIRKSKVFKSLYLYSQKKLFFFST